MKDNKLIAEFMGLEPNEVGVYQVSKHQGYSLDFLQYHTSWDWLMPVVEKINQVCGYDDYNTSRLHLQRVLDDCINENAVGIDEVHKAVVEFIKQYADLPF